MRLTCPNCGAQYEVPDDVIPQDGRDVQCSNCGTTWFQPHADAAPVDTPEPDPEELRSALEDLGEMPEPAPSEDAPKPDAPDELPDQVPSPQRRELDPEVTDILKEEAEHEAKLRASEGAGLETQPDLGLDDTGDDAERRAREARERMERLKGPAQQTDEELEEAVAVAAAAAQSSRRDRLPDIDELNSSLRASSTPLQSDQTEDESLRETPRKSGFARGFAIPIILVVVLMLLYVNAPRLAEAVPALGPVLNTYVQVVDQARTWLDGVITSFMP